MSNLWTPAYVGVGSNLAEPYAQAMRGLQALSQLPASKLILASSLYRTTPVGPQDQPDFVNAVAALLTQLDSVSLLRALKSLERELGREQPVQRWGPRLIDFDLLVVGDQRLNSDELTLPHPALHERSFVLVPFAEIAPDVFVPGQGSVRQLAARMQHGGIEKISTSKPFQP